MTSERFRFGVFEFDTATGQLLRNDTPVPLQAQPAQVLGCLLQRAGQPVSREDLREAVWGAGTFVDFDRGLNFCISQIRSALRDDSTQPLYVRTIPKYGYEFIAPVQRIRDHAPEVRDTVAVKKTSSMQSRLGLMIFVAGLLTLAAVYAARFRQSSKPLPIVAVLRFDNETANPAMTQFSDALTDNTVEQLTSQSRGRYSVIGNAQILRLPREQRDLTAIGSSLHASYVVLGQVQANNGQVRILAHLIHLPEQTHVWVARMDRSVADPLNVESEVAQRIASEFSVRVVPSPFPRTSLSLVKH